MANELLDFVMSLVRDPDAAARYAENPRQAIADAHLTNVTIGDVSNLIPVVSESLSMATPGHGAAVADGNVWASGAATAAFDAFADHMPAPVTFEPAASLLDQSSVDPSVVQFADPGPDLHQFQVGDLDQAQPMLAEGLHEVAPPVAPTPLDHSVGLDHAVGGEHSIDHSIDYNVDHGFDTLL
jgi:hypothetical protein